MRIDFREVEFSSKQIDNRFYSIRTLITSCFIFGCLKDGIKSLQYSITDLIMYPIYNSLPMSLDRISGLFDEFYEAMSSPEIPFSKQLVKEFRRWSLIDLFVSINLPTYFYKEP